MHLSFVVITKTIVLNSSIAKRRCFEEKQIEKKLFYFENFISKFTDFKVGEILNFRWRKVLNHWKGMD